MIDWARFVIVRDILGSSKMNKKSNKQYIDYKHVVKVIHISRSTFLSYACHSVQCVSIICILCSLNAMFFFSIVSDLCLRFDVFLLYQISHNLFFS